ncbi:MAG: glycoside hydrolase family 95 protein [Lachnospiraceae bacterium]|nr:glycoside hydrolase family 95 protein [Lachnospiraceae bacterium]
MKQIWYKQPAIYWEEALPVGNGRLGAMVYGDPREESIQLNEETVWSGEKIDRCNPASREHLEEIRSLVFAGKVREAEQLALYAMAGTPQSQRAYQTLGTLHISHHDLKEEEPDAYQRKLLLEDAVAVTQWRRKETFYQQKVFASFPDDVLVIHLSAVGEEKLSFSCYLDREKNFDHSFAADEKTITFDGDTGGMQYCGVLSVGACDGCVETIGESLIITQATEATLIFSAATSFRQKDPFTFALQTVRKACEKENDELLENHRADYRRLYDRVTLEFDSDPKWEELPTDQRIAAFLEDGSDRGLVSLYFQFGRYLMISGSRPGGLPLTLMGLWNEDFAPPWESKYTININTEMNYWPVEICNLSECSEPYFTMLQRVMESGRHTARRMYGCGGFMAHHNIDIYADTEPQDRYIPATFWVMGGAMLAQQIWEHYQFTKDLEFLEKNYQVLYEAVLFFKDFLVEDEKGQLVTCPSVSPENTYRKKDGSTGCMCAAPTMDNELLHQLFSDFAAASRELGKTELVAEALEMDKKLPPFQIGSRGQIMEWQEEYEETEPGHRHISHLYGLFPCAQITLENTPKLAAAARITLENRISHGGGYTGWSRAWLILFWTRLQEGDKAYENLRKLIDKSTFPNMMDYHPLDNYKRGKIFQIDGNLGGTTGIAEMLVQSHNGQILLLPALPEQLPDGYVKGLRVRGNAAVDITWKNGKMQETVFLPDSDLTTRLCCGAYQRQVKLQAGKQYRFDETLTEIKGKC